MPIIYEPYPNLVSLKDAAGNNALKAVLLAVADFVQGESKPWAYYAGVGVGGGLAAATGLPAASIVLYVTGDILDAAILHSPDSSNVRIFLNGVAVSTFETWAATTAWELAQIVLDEGVNVVEFVSLGVGAQNTSGIPWFGISQITVTGGAEELQEVPGITMPSIISIQVQEAADAGGVHSIPIYVEDGLTLAQYLAFAQAAAIAINGAHNLLVVGAVLQANLNIVGPFTAADPDADGDIGVLLQMSTENARTYSTRIPGILNSRFAGKSLPRGANGSAVDVLVDLFETGVDVGGGAGVKKPLTPDGIALTTLKGLTKSTRKL